MAKGATKTRRPADREARRMRLDEETVRSADPATLPLSEKPRTAPGGTAGRASHKERRDPVDHASDESFPASDPPAH